MRPVNLLQSLLLESIEAGDGDRVMGEFKAAQVTAVISDIHLADAEPPHPDNALWKRYKRPRFFVDRTVREFLGWLDQNHTAPIELILNGDIFDFDSVMAIPERLDVPVGWLERHRGLVSEESKSLFKIKLILTDHSIWCDAMREFISKGHRVIFTIGNHDMELHWPSVQEEVRRALSADEASATRIRFCEWFYISNSDTLIEHGNQYDNYCTASNPVNPLIRVGSRVRVRLPFGNLAGKNMLNGMGLMNPHVEASFIKATFAEYIVFFFKYVMRTQPLLLWTYFWSAGATLIVSVMEGLLPALVDPLSLEQRVEDIAEKANAKPATVRSLRALHDHPAVFNPLQILRELWLDRAFLLIGMLGISFFFFSVLNLFDRVSLLWFVAPLVLLFPLFMFYARRIKSEIRGMERNAISKVPMIQKMTGVDRVVFGHSHHEYHAHIQGVEILNPGTWSPSYRDPECTDPYGRKCFVLIKPESGSTKRLASLWEWGSQGVRKIEPLPDLKMP